jgi:hypothetical protein
MIYPDEEGASSRGAQGHYFFAKNLKHAGKIAKSSLGGPVHVRLWAIHPRGFDKTKYPKAVLELHEMEHGVKHPKSGTSILDLRGGKSFYARKRMSNRKIKTSKSRCRKR